MKYIIIDQIKNGDLFTEEFETKNEAIEAAQASWNHLSPLDKSRRESFYVLESVNADEEAVDHLDGDTVVSFK